MLAITSEYKILFYFYMDYKYVFRKTNKHRPYINLKYFFIWATSNLTASHWWKMYLSFTHVWDNM